MAGRNRFNQPGSVLAGIDGGLSSANAQTRVKVEHPFRVIKRQFDYVKVLFSGLMKNSAQLTTLAALPNLWKRLETADGYG